MRQQAAAAGQLRPGLHNGPSADPSHPHTALSRTSPLNHTAVRPPRAAQPVPNGPCASSPAGQPGHSDAGSLGNNHTLGPGGGGVSNGNVPYLQQNSLPHNCTATSHPSTSSSSTTTNSPSDEAWRSQQRHNTSRVAHWLISLTHDEHLLSPIISPTTLSKCSLSLRIYCQVLHISSHFLVFWFAV